MAKLLKLRRGTTTQHGSFTGAEGEITIDTTKDTAVVHDGSTAGGRPLARQDMNNVPAGTILGTQLENSGVTAGSYGSSTSIPSITIDAQGLITAASGNTVNTDLVGDTSPQLGGDLASNGHDIKFADDDKAIFGTGTGNDLEIFHESTSNTNEIIAADGDIHIQADNFQLISDDAGGRAIYLNDSGGHLELGFKGNHDARFAGNQVTFLTNVDANAGLDVTGNITVSGTVDGVDVATRDTLFGGLTSSSGVLTDGVTATTQAQSDSSSKVSTTSYVRTAIQNAQAFPSGTKMLFQQTAAPTGWTKVTSNVDNKSLRVVSGTVGSGGSNAFSNTFTNKSITANAANATQGGNITVSDTSAGGNVSIDSATTGGTVDSHTLTTNQMPSHVHYMYTNSYHQQSNRYANSAGFYPGYNGQQTRENAGNNRRQTYNSGYGESVGGDGGHSHGFTGGSHNHNGTLSGTAHSHNASFTGSAHNHSITVNNLDLAVQYLDVIIAAKD